MSADDAAMAIGAIMDESISPVRTLGSMARVPGGITRPTALAIWGSRAPSPIMSMRSSRPSLSKTSCAVATSMNTTLESTPGTLAGMMPATRSDTTRSPANPRRIEPRFKRYLAATRSLMNAPCSSTST